MLSGNRNYQNINKKIYTNYEKDNYYDIPSINATQYDFCDFIDYKNCKSIRDEEKKNVGIHFFIEDYHFLSLWNRPDKYISILSKFKYVLAPDFSLYRDFPKALQIFNHYRKQWLSKYYQEAGINIIPTVSWSDESSYEWCFLGVPRKSIVAISSVGTQKSGESKELFIKGYEKMLEILEPDKIIFYGKVPDECRNRSIEIIEIKPFYERLRKI